MKVLYVDTTAADLVVAIITENEIFDYSLTDCGTHHSETLCNQVQKALSACRLKFSDLDGYACAVGPGSFTGIRIGISTLKGYATACPKPFISVVSLEALALSDTCGCKLRAAIDAGNGYYFADYKDGVEPCLIPYGDIRLAAAATGKSTVTYLNGAAKIVRKKYNEGKFEELIPLYIRRSQAEERYGRT